ATSGIAIGDRADATNFVVRNAARWMVLPSEQLVFEATVANSLTGATLLSDMSTVYDAADRGLPIETQIAMAPGTVARTLRTFDTYGNVVTLGRPNQVALGAAGKVATTTYDAVGARPIAVVDELGHR